MRRILYEYRKDGVLNLRDVEIEANGDLHAGGHDLDPALESFVGDTEWEGDVVVRAEHVPKVRAALRKEFGEDELLDLIERKFGGTIHALTRFEEWLRQQGIPFE